VVEVIVQLIGIALGLVVLWTGFRKLELSRFLKAVLTILDLALLAIATISLGWLGL
jgi:hypothetical protein